MKIKYVNVLFELVNGNEKKLAYSQFEPYEFYSYAFMKKNQTKEDIIIDYIGLLVTNANISHDSINIILILDKPIDSQYLLHFGLILDQKTDSNLKINCTDPEYVLFDASDYEADEFEYGYHLVKDIRDDDFEFVTECISDLWDISTDFDQAKEQLEEALKKANDRLKTFDETDFGKWTEEEISIEKQSLISCIPWITSKIKELEEMPRNYDKSFIELKLKKSRQKINFYEYLKKNKLVKENKCSIKIANQILRQEKLKDLEKIKYNFVIKDFSYKKNNNGMKHYQIKFQDVNEQIEGIYKMDKKGYYSCSGYYCKEDIDINSENQIDLDDEYLKDIFQGEIFDELFGHSSGDDRYDNCDCDD